MNPKKVFVVEVAEDTQSGFLAAVSSSPGSLATEVPHDLVYNHIRANEQLKLVLGFSPEISELVMLSIPKDSYRDIVDDYANRVMDFIKASVTQPENKILEDSSAH